MCFLWRYSIYKTSSLLNTKKDKTDQVNKYFQNTTMLKQMTTNLYFIFMKTARVQKFLVNMKPLKKNIIMLWDHHLIYSIGR